MDDGKRKLLINNEREWRRYQMEQIEKLISKIDALAIGQARIKVWNKVYQISMAAVFSFVLAVFGAYIEWKFNRLQ